MSAPIIFSGGSAKLLKSTLDFFGQSQILSGTSDPTSVATLAPVGSLYLNSSTGIIYRKNDAGSTTNWTALNAQRLINAQSGTTYTFVLADGSQYGGNPLVTLGSASATTVTVPPNSSVAFPIGTQIDCVQQGAGKVTFAQGAGVTINSKGGNKSISAQYVGTSLVKTATDTWTLLGDLVA